MAKKSKYRKAWDRWTEEVDLSEFTDVQEVIESFTEWLNPEAGKIRGLDRFEEFVRERFEEYVKELPTEEAAWYERIAPRTPETIRPQLKELYERALTQPTLAKAEEVIYRMPARMWQELPHEALKEIQESLRLFFLK